MTEKKREAVGVIEASGRKAARACIAAGMILCAALFATSAFAQAVAPLNASPLVKLGDKVRYGSYVIYKIGEGIYKINDPGVTTGKGGAWGVWHRHDPLAPRDGLRGGRFEDAAVTAKMFLIPGAGQSR